MTFEEAVAGFPPERINDTPPNVDYSPWHLLEHIRLSQRDILDFIREAQYTARNWPADYWPAPSARADGAGWERTVGAFLDDRAALEAIVVDPEVHLLAPLRGDESYTVMREVLLVADHTAYHTGEFAILRQVMGTWPAGRK